MDEKRSDFREEIDEATERCNNSAASNSGLTAKTSSGDQQSEEMSGCGSEKDDKQHPQNAGDDVEGFPMDRDNGSDAGCGSGNKKSKSVKPWMLLLAFGAVLLIGYTSIHSWSEPTCTEPATCTICGKQKGEPIGHKWRAATCTKPKVCKVCGETSGVPLGHHVPDDVWIVDKEATCTEEGHRSGACDRCGAKVEQSTPKADHVEAEPEVVTQPSLNSLGGVTPGTRVVKCSVCGAELRSEEFALSVDELAAQFKAQCESPSYQDVARNPDAWEGHKVKFRGEVIQVMESNSDYTLRVNVTQERYGWSDTIMVSYHATEGSPRILEDDVMTFFGTMAGMYSYESVMGATITVPLMHAQFVE